MTTLSVIVPCFNCERTLEAAVSSIYRDQPEIPFDVTLVDDGSLDSTFDVMRRLAAGYSNIRLVRHDSNKGGGAARNTAAAHSAGELIFCLDADDLLGPGFLKNMTRFWLAKRCDGVGMSTSVKFRGSNVQDVAYVTDFEGVGRPVRFESFLGGAAACSLTVVFLMTRHAFVKAGGYPTDHGFDTQGMAFRFLCNGLTAYTCPDTLYYHRVEYDRSYYLREYSAGLANWNWFCIFDEFLYVFSNEVKAQILSSDLFARPGRPEPPALRDLVAAQKHPYDAKYRQLIKVGRDGAARQLAPSVDKFAQYWLGQYYLSKREYGPAINRFKQALSLGFDYRIIYYRMLLAALRLSGRQILVKESLEELALYSQPYPMERRPLRHRLVDYAETQALIGPTTRWLNSRWIRLRRRLHRRGR